MKNAYFAVGSRKTATAKVWIREGKGRIFMVNEQEPNEYFKRFDLVETIRGPFETTGTKGKFDVVSKVHGGGLSAQADALSLGIARALVKYNSELRKTLKSADMLKRDERKKERMKYGLAKRRKRFQFSKR